MADPLEAALRTPALHIVATLRLRDHNPCFAIVALSMMQKGMTLMQPAALPQRPTSLARATLIRMGFLIAAIIALATFFSYLHVYRSLRAEALIRLEQSVSERSQREEAIFVQAEDNHVILKKALEERFQAWRQEDPNARFDSLFEKLPDGTTRSHREGFDSAKMPGVFIPSHVTVDGELRRRVLASHDVLVQYGPAYRVRFSTTAITLPEGVVLGYWPEAGTWANELEPTYSIQTAQLFTIGLPQNNPQRQTTWTGIYWDEATHIWLASATTPLDIAGRHVASITHDVLLEELLARSANDRLPGAFNVIFRDDGQLLAHPELSTVSATTAYNILGDTEHPAPGAAQISSPQRRAHLRDIFERVKNRAPGQSVLELPEHGEYLAVARLKGTGWNFVTLLDESRISQPAFQAARYVLLFGVASLLIELVIMYWVLRQQITRPLGALTQATDQVAAGNFKAELNTSRNDELGRLARSFLLMADKVHHREEALRQANEGLEQRLTELKEVQGRLVETARQAGMAEVATNVLHNVGNVLTSVQTSAGLAKSRLAGLRLEQLSPLAGMLEEHRNDLTTYINQDERGRSVLPYLSQLGQHVQEGRKEISTLLDEVSRYTHHIGVIIKLQQDHAKHPRLNEPISLAETIEEALQMHRVALERSGVKAECSLADVPPVLTDKHKVLTILVNLISNARYAMEATPENERILTLRMGLSGSDRVRLEVSDTGMGIAQEMLPRIFQHGFTTRKEGHGFGLHSSALAAQQLGGALSVQSDGPGRGATFTLELPCPPVEGPK